MSTEVFKTPGRVIESFQHGLSKDLNMEVSCLVSASCLLIHFWCAAAKDVVPKAFQPPGWEFVPVRLDRCVHDGKRPRGLGNVTSDMWIKCIAASRPLVTCPPRRESRIALISLSTVDKLTVLTSRDLVLGTSPWD